MGNFLSKATSTIKPSSEKMASGPAAFKHYAKAQSSFKPPLIANENAFLGDVFTRSVQNVDLSLFANAHALIADILPLCNYHSEKNDPEKPVSCGFYRLESGTPLVYTYTYHEMKIIVEGEFDISDETGQEVHAVAGDVFYFPKGSVITFKTKSYGLAFYTGQRAEGAA